MITYAALSPHPPIILPEVGRGRIREAQPTVEGMEAMARELVASEPDTIVFFTPHGNVFSDCITYLADPQLQGDLSDFGCPQVRSRCPNDLRLVEEISQRAWARGIQFIAVTPELAHRHRLNPRLVHGIMVPLYYLEQAGWRERSIVAISVGYLEKTELYALGAMIRDAADALGRKVAILASGDMSHRLKNEGPYDYHPDGPRFDREVRELLAAGDVNGLLNIPQQLRDNAGECGYMSIVIMLGSMDGSALESRVFSYEGPFGVGYLVAGIKAGPASRSWLAEMEAGQARAAASRRGAESMPVRWARMNLEGHLRDHKSPRLPQDMESLTKDQAGVFVSLKKNGQLRGCIGTFLPAYANLAEEISHNALAAGLHDPRFPAVEAAELDSLVYSVDVLTPPEPSRREDLDPRKYGVIVKSGSRRGLLLPDLEGVDTVEEQLSIALQKAGISPREKYDIERFEVRRFT